MRALVVVLALAFSTVARATTIAVLPFRDLTGGRGSIGEAISQTVTADLRGLHALRVVERTEIDRVLAEHDLTSSRASLDDPSTVRIGKLLGAELIATGGYQHVGSSVRITARVVKVATGEIVGTAKVDGPDATLLGLEDRVTASLLRSAGLKDNGTTVAARKRVPLKSVRAFELYGDAVAEPDEQKRASLLRESIAADPSFSYASADLDALEESMRALAAVSSAAQRRELSELRKQVEVADDAHRAQIEVQLLVRLLGERRWIELMSRARAISNEKPEAARKDLEEFAAAELVDGDERLHRTDDLLRDGEAFVKRFPASNRAQLVQSNVQRAIELRRKEESGMSTATASVAAMSSRQRWNLCDVAQRYKRAYRYPEARRLYRACVDLGGATPVAYFELVQLDAMTGDWPEAKRDLARVTDPSLHKAAELEIPTDG